MLRILLLLTALAFGAGAQAGSSDQEIEYLIEKIAASGCTYTRNGTDHDSAGAADHLRLKYSRGKRHADTAENFIDRLASESSWTGKPYTITCEGVTEPSAQYLHRALLEYRQAPASGG